MVFKRINIELHHQLLLSCNTFSIIYIYIGVLVFMNCGLADSYQIPPWYLMIYVCSAIKLSIAAAGTVATAKISLAPDNSARDLVLSSVICRSSSL